MANNISYKNRTAKRMNRLKARLEEEEYKDGDNITWDTVLVYLLKQSGEWEVLSKTNKPKNGVRKITKPFQD